MRGDEGSVLVLSPSPLIPPVARNRRSAPVVVVVSAEVGDDRWGQGVSDRGFENGIFLFQK